MRLKIVFAGVALSWLLVSTVGMRHLSDRGFLVALGGVMVLTGHVLQRGPVLLEVLQLGRRIERERASALVAQRAAVDTPTVDLYRKSKAS
ncbi:hypothetical protein AB0C02_30325 [Micromonospora sp. NPDC048999]|uniref:hypothetical protein n=1 Tax=Micromonospora sp. NPDC048999 TaxID=3155391 RepID=UPI00340E3F8A